MLRIFGFKMSNSNSKLHLIHGECEYLIFKELKDLKSKLREQGISITEFIGSKNLNFLDIHSAIESNDLFGSASVVIVRDLMDSRSFFPFVEKLTEYLNDNREISNDIYLFNSGKILKTSKLYKAIVKKGEAKELAQPKPEEILDVIHKSINITDDASRLLLEYSNSNLFLIRNEIKKLQNLLSAKNKSKVDVKDIESICVKSMTQGAVWGIGSKFLNFCLQPTDKKLQKELLQEIDTIIESNIPTMQILYSFYQYTLNAIKMKQMLAKGKNFRDCMGLGYFFVKEFFDKRDKMKIDELIKINSLLLDYEYQVKSGNVEEVMGMRKLIIN